VLVFGWLLFGLAGLFTTAALLSLQTPAGQYVSPYGALQYLLTGGKVVPSSWPWGQASLAGILTKAASDAALAPVSGIKSVVQGIKNPINGAPLFSQQPGGLFYGTPHI
jgi:hypothetical protein